MKKLKKFFLDFHNLSLKYLLPLFIFLLPTQLGIHFWPNWSFISGVRIDYLSPTIYVEDLIALTLLFSFFFHQIFSQGLPQLKRKFLLIGFFILLFISINILHAINPFVALFKWVRILYLFLISTFLFKEEKIDFKKGILLPFCLSLIFFSLLGLIQVFIKRNLGGIFYFFGERDFSIFTPGIALSYFKNLSFLRAYSTFSHPNSLAGFLGLSFFMLLELKIFFKGRIFYPIFVTSLIIVVLGIVFSFSYSAILALIFSIFFYLFLKYIAKKNLRKISFLSLGIFLTAILFSLIFPAISQYLLERYSFPSNLEERLFLSLASEKMFSHNFLIGIGLNNFFNQLVLNFSWARYSWLIQPVHNIFLLVLTETGFLGFFFSLFILFRLLAFIIKREKFFFLAGFIFIILTGLADHYWLTLPQNLYLLFLFFTFSLKF